MALSRAIHWFRRDLRLFDNTALFSASRDFDDVYPVFVLDDHYAQDASVGPSRFVFLRESLAALERDVRDAGGRLSIIPGPPARALPELLAATGAGAVYANEEIGPYPQRRDAEVRAAIEGAGGRFRLFSDSVAVDPRSIASGEGRPYTVFTPFSKKWRAAEKAEPFPAPSALAAAAGRSAPVEKVRAWKDLAANPRAPRGGERAARAALDGFLEGIGRYSSVRDSPAADGTSRLSAALHFGTLSPRTVLSRARAAWRGADPESRKSVEKFADELCWRDFLHALLFHFPHAASGAFRREMDALEWDEPGERFEAWKAGRTGYPFVDAAMRQLLDENWMHNRARMVAASFLTRDLHVDWREGERWFSRQLADADLANNNGGWQWAAGTGADAGPWFRVFNPLLQGKKFDPSGDYVRRHVPELAHLPAEEIHQARNPIVDHAAEREEALRRYGRVVEETRRSRVASDGSRVGERK